MLMAVEQPAFVVLVLLGKNFINNKEMVFKIPSSNSCGVSGESDLGVEGDSVADIAKANATA